MFLRLKINKLLFDSQLIDDNAYSFEFKSSYFVIKDSKQPRIAQHHKWGKLFTFNDRQIEVFNIIEARWALSKIWHARLGHPNYVCLKSLEDKKVINVVNLENAVLVVNLEFLL